jgi:hypothetical protein
MNKLLKYVYFIITTLTQIQSLNVDTQTANAFQI